MARRYGGKHSPGGASDQPREEILHEDRKVDAAGARANILFVPGVVLAFTSLNEGATGLILGLAGAAVLTLAAWLTRDGLRAHAAYDARKVARRPALPRKIFGAVLTGVGIGIAAYANGDGLLASGLFALAAGGLHIAAFGPDPLRDKRMEGIDSFQQDRVARVVDEAEAYLTAMRDHIATLKDRRLEGRVMQFQATARQMIRTVEEDPRDLTGARKFLGVYLMGARDASAKFAEHYRRTGDADARAHYEALLSDLEQNFAARTEKMLLDDRSDMDVEIKVLRDRLQREGL
ncbi:5-bromo-4-chloroindolyl phosphate hydrolysis family protein [Salibaculum griseiflavum]|uniref:5-bromo-4-chloroindolyl phosphate hydrolysis protein n=1 Tax=Salibaculum griseiflavum TaxID=1914409 RepID=A0A2V1P3M1_9RHOB|nr:5-bromo-4-chloroindolyl phosphate hydrolysis family protein [Salibaculum griseiflavum]PWG15912.1 hypothetical protein DFK10_14585 [Salibaculum griseiflavum]